MLKYEKRAWMESEHYKAYPKECNSPCEVLSNPSENEGDTESKDDYYPPSLVLLWNPDKEVVIVSLVPS